jgi:hypothetical protein
MYLLTQVHIRSRLLNRLLALLLGDIVIMPRSWHLNIVGKGAPSGNLCPFCCAIILRSRKNANVVVSFMALLRHHRFSMHRLRTGNALIAGGSSKSVCRRGARQAQEQFIRGTRETSRSPFRPGRGDNSVDLVECTPGIDRQQRQKKSGSYRGTVDVRSRYTELLTSLRRTARLRRVHRLRPDDADLLCPSTLRAGPFLSLESHHSVRHLTRYCATHSVCTTPAQPAYPTGWTAPSALWIDAGSVVCSLRSPPRQDSRQGR